MTDEKAAELLGLLAEYVRECQGEPVPAGSRETPIDLTRLALREVAGDLWDSLPLDCRSEEVREAAVVCEADSLRPVMRLVPPNRERTSHG